MESPTERPAVPSGGVRTPAGPSLCPVCREKPLKQRQEVCSGRCRALRYRRTQKSRESALRAALEQAGQIIQEALKP
jgi:hypothetical protein